MPISSPRRLLLRSTADQPTRRRSALPVALLAAALCALPLGAAGQQLAHPNWVGNNISNDPWWQHAVIYRVDLSPASGVDFKYLSARVNAMRSVGIDALLLPAPAIPASAAAEAAAAAVTATAQTAAPPQAATTEIDQLDDLVRAASARGIRVLLTLDGSPSTTDLSGVARFWLARGIAGFYVTAPSGSNPAEMQATVQLLRRIAGSVVGQRIVISSSDFAESESGGSFSTPTPLGRRSSAAARVARTDAAPQLELDTQMSHLATLDAAALRRGLADTMGQPNLLLDFDLAAQLSVATTSAAKGLSEITATLALLTHPSSMIESSVKLVLDPAAPAVDVADDDQPKPAPARSDPNVYLPFKPYVPPGKKAQAQAAPKDALTSWYKQLASLHHGSGALRAGSQNFLDFDAQNVLVWVARPVAVTNVSPAVVVACNLSASPATIALRTPLEGLGLHGNYLRTLLRSDRALGPQDLNSVVLPPYSVYIGEVRR